MMDGANSHDPRVGDEELRHVVARLFEVEEVRLHAWTVAPLGYGVMNPVTHGLHRAAGTADVAGEQRRWTVIRKEMGFQSESDPQDAWEISDQPDHWNYWRREFLAYEEGLTTDLGPALHAPKYLGGSLQSDDRAVVWLEEVEGAPAEQWTTDRYARSGEHLGQWQGRYGAHVPLPEVPWLSRQWLRSLVPTRISAHVRSALDDSMWSTPLARQALDPSMREDVAVLWERSGELLDRLSTLDRTVCHFDFRTSNLFDGGASRTDIIDWAFVGLGAVGEDLTSLITDSVFMSFVPPQHHEQLERDALDGYLRGLREVGWSGDQDAVRFAYWATTGIRFGLSYGWLVELANDEQQAGVQEQRYGRPIVDILRDRVEAVRHSLRLGHQALAMLD